MTAAANMAQATHANLGAAWGLARLIAVTALVCAALAAPAQPRNSVEAFLGTWSGVFTTQDHEYWTAADLMCFPGCPLDLYETLTALLNDPANDKRSVGELAGQAGGVSGAAFAKILTPLGKRVMDANEIENDPKLHCQPYGFVREVTNPLPMSVRRDGEHLLVHYEEWSQLRTIYMDGRAHPVDRTPTLLGHSVGRIEDGALVVETQGLTPDWISDQSHAGHSGDLKGVERYVVKDNPRRLELTLTLTDPAMFTQPLVVTKTWLATPDVELLQDRCSQLPGKF
jgi:hypothetical protein